MKRGPVGIPEVAAVAAGGDVARGWEPLPEQHVVRVAEDQHAGNGGRGKRRGMISICTIS